MDRPAEADGAPAPLPRLLSGSVHLERRPVAEWADRVHLLRERDGAVFVDLFAGPSEADDCGTMTMLLARPDEHDWVALRDTGVAASGYPSLTRRIPAADWYERELFASRHIVPLGHPHLAPLGLDREMTADRILLDRPLEPADIGVVDYPLGPVRSGIVESGHYTLRSVGEEIVDLRLQLAYKHRGIEDLATGVAWPLLPLLAERISGTDAVANALASCIALEALGGLVPTPRAQALRLIAAELERLHDHAAFQAELCQATGLSVAQAQFEIVRERLLRLAARLVGHRYLFGFVVPGGVAVDLDPAALEDLRRTVVEARAALATLGSMVAGSGSHLDRLRGTGRVSLTQAADLALTGPVARAAGLDIDARRDLPYGAYAARGVAVASAEGGDAAARAAVRQAESLISADLIVDTVDHLPDGPAAVEPVRIDAAPLAATSAALGWAEGSRGTELHWLETDGAGRVARYRIRSASFACWQVFARSIPGSNILTDFPIIEQSFGLSFAGADR